MLERLNRGWIPVLIIAQAAGLAIWWTWFNQLAKWREASPITVFIASICVAALLLPLIIGQFGVNWQPIQFGYYAILFMTIPTVIQLDNWFKKCSALQTKIIWVIIVMLGLPCIIHSLVVMRWGSVVSKAELEAYHYLEEHVGKDKVIFRPLIPKQRDEIGAKQLKRVIAHGEIMSLDDIKDKAQEVKTASNQFLRPSPPPVKRQPLRMSDSAFVAAFSKRNSYLEDITTAQSMGFNYQSRLELVQKILSLDNALDMKNVLQAEQIDYLILFDQDRLQVDIETVGLKEVFKNKLVKIYQVDK